MAPASDMGYTWGHYQGLTTDSSGHQTRQTGRYVTIWKKQANGPWKVSLEASAEDAPRACSRYGGRFLLICFYRWN